jgi:hypothetical protein
LTAPPEENLEDMLENQEPLRWGDRYDRFSSELVRASVGRAEGVWLGEVFVEVSVCVGAGAGEAG